MLINMGGGNFVEAAAAHGMDSLGDGRGLAVSDFDGDGDLDFVISNYHSPANYFVNGVARGHWLRIRLRGRNNNRDGVGAVIRATTGERTQMRVVTAGDGYASQCSRVAHFGLGDAQVVDNLSITWPDGLQQTFLSVEADRLIDIDEYDKHIRTERLDVE